MESRGRSGDGGCRAARGWSAGLATLLGLVLGLAACGPQEPAGAGALGLTFARWAAEGPCPEVPAAEPVPPELDRLEVTLRRADGTVHARKSIDLTQAAEARLGGIDAGEDLSLEVVGSSGGAAEWRGSARGLTVRSGKATRADVFMSRISDTSCTHRPLTRPRVFLAAGTLADGRVVLAGGAEPDGLDCGAGCRSFTASSQTDLFDPGVGVIYPVSRMHSPRALASVTALPGGGLLVVGGVRRLRLVDDGALPFAMDEADLVPSFEVYLPGEDRWIEKPLPGGGRVFHSATSLPDGRVLVIGGGTSFATAHDTALLFDPAGESVGDFVAVGSPLACPRLGHAAVLAGDKIIVVGGATFPTISPIEEYTPGADGGVFVTRTVGGDALNLFFHDAALIPLRPDEILVAGGSFFDEGSGRLLVPSPASVRVYSISQGQADTVPEMAEPRLLPRLVSLGAAGLLLAGGFTDLLGEPGAALELFDPEANAFSTPSSGDAPVTLSVPRAGHGAAGLLDGRALLVGGLGPGGDTLGSGELFTTPVGQ